MKLSRATVVAGFIGILSSVLPLQAQMRQIFLTHQVPKGEIGMDAMVTYIDSAGHKQKAKAIDTGNGVLSFYGNDPKTITAVNLTKKDFAGSSVWEAITGPMDVEKDTVKQIILLRTASQTSY